MSAFDVYFMNCICCELVFENYCQNKYKIMNLKTFKKTAKNSQSQIKRHICLTKKDK